MAKSGQVSEIIYNASKGSKFFNHEESRDKVLTEKIERILAQKARLERLDLSLHTRRADEYIAELELSRDLSQTVVHVDCDAFFAAVEELDRPELKTVPMAVGKGVLTTCNYHARKFGCRSGMATFVAKKLCPDLICIPQNFDKYNAKAREIRAILVEYDPRFESASVDEAFLNITAYCEENQVGPEEAVQQMRARILEETKISVSAGIAPNAKLAKIASNRNKPNGQFYIPNNRTAIMNFMQDLPVRKVNGIGRVFERELDAIGIKTCGGIYPQRAFLAELFGEKAFQFLMQCYLGVGRTKIQPAEEYERKSVGTESTFAEIGDRDKIREKLRWVADELEKDLARTQFKGRTLLLKVKLHTFEVLTRQTVPPKAVCLADDLYSFALPMLVKLEKEIPNMKLRLLGLRCTNLVSTKKVGIDFFGLQFKPKLTNHQPRDDTKGSDERELNTEEEFEQAARQERHDEMNELERLSQEITTVSAEESDEHTSMGRGGTLRADSNNSSTENQNQNLFWDCPICLRPQAADDRTFNTHMDFCLSKQTIIEAVKGSLDSSEPDSNTSQPATLLGQPQPPRNNKRKMTTSAETDSRQRRLFFN
jgi:DNA polymerase kappa